jgi:hypothetical protein
MATGPGLTSLLPVAMMVVGVVTILRGRRKGRAGDADRDESTTRQDAAMEMERRMASYLAQRDMGRVHGMAGDRDGQENGR